MSVKPYPIDEDGVSMAAEPSVQESISKRRVSMAEVMSNSITLEESQRILEERIYRFYHPEV